jgi:hypothetical protein
VLNVGRASVQHLGSFIEKGIHLLDVYENASPSPRRLTEAGVIQPWKQARKFQWVLIKHDQEVPNQWLW